MKKRVIFIVGLSHSGSTLLGSILGSNPTDSFDIFHTGECYPYFNPKHYGFGHPESARMKKDPIWEAIDPKVGKKDVLEAIFEATGAHTIVDSGKNRVWLRRCIKECKAKGYDYEALISWRSPIKAIYSFWKRDMPASRWSEEMVELQTTLKAFDAYNLVDISALVAQPREQTKIVCEKLGLPYFPGKQRYWAWHHAHMSGAKLQRKHIRNPESAKYIKSSKMDPAFDVDAQRITIKPHRSFINEIIEHKV